MNATRHAAATPQPPATGPFRPAPVRSRAGAPRITLGFGDDRCSGAILRPDPHGLTPTPRRAEPSENQLFKVPGCGNAGVTLIELMTTVAIIGILAAIAFPAYNSYTVRSNRSEAQQFMMDVASREEEYLLNNRAYTTSLTTLYAAASDPTPTRVQSYYTVTVTTAATPPAFTITATPKTGTKQVSDGTLTYQSDGVKTPSSKW